MIFRGELLPFIINKRRQRLIRVNKDIWEEFEKLRPWKDDQIQPKKKRK